MAAQDRMWNNSRFHGASIIDVKQVYLDEVRAERRFHPLYSGDSFVEGVRHVSTIATEHTVTWMNKRDKVKPETITCLQVLTAWPKFLCHAGSLDLPGMVTVKKNDGEKEVDIRQIDPTCRLTDVVEEWADHFYVFLTQHHTERYTKGVNTAEARIWLQQICMLAAAWRIMEAKYETKDPGVFADPKTRAIIYDSLERKKTIKAASEAIHRELPAVIKEAAKDGAITVTIKDDKIDIPTDVIEKLANSLATHLIERLQPFLVEVFAARQDHWNALSQSDRFLLAEGA